jgi:hypothetical protein
MPFYSIPNTRSLDQGTKKIDNCNNNKKQPEKKRPTKQGEKNSGIEKSGIRQLAEIEEAAYKIRKEGLDRCGSACDAATRDEGRSEADCRSRSRSARDRPQNLAV